MGKWKSAYFHRSLKNLLNKVGPEEKPRVKALLVEIEQSHLEDKKDAVWSVDNSPVSANSNPLGSEHKKTEVPTTDRLINFRNPLFIQPFEMIDPNKKKHGLKIFHENYRPNRRRAVISIEGEAVVKKKLMSDITIDPD